MKIIFSSLRKLWKTRVFQLNVANIFLARLSILSVTETYRTNTTQHDSFRPHVFPKCSKEKKEHNSKSRTKPRFGETVYNTVGRKTRLLTVHVPIFDFRRGGPTVRRHANRVRAQPAVAPDEIYVSEPCANKPTPRPKHV